jgi:hypothetical protein
MVQTFFKRSCTIDRLRQGPLAGHIDLLAARLATHGYSRVHSRIQLRLVMIQHVLSAGVKCRPPASAHNLDSVSIELDLLCYIAVYVVLDWQTTFMVGPDVLWRNITDTGFPETPAYRIASLSELADNEFSGVSVPSIAR